MTFGLVQQNATTNGSGTQTSVTCAFGSALTAGNLILVAVTGNTNGTDVSGVTDSKGNAYAVCCALQTDAVGPIWNKAYYAVVTSGGTGDTVTVALSGSTFATDVRIYEFSGFAGTPTLDASGGQTQNLGGGGTMSSGAAVLTTQAVELLFGTCGTTGGVSAYGAGWTGAQITSNGDADEYQSVTTTGSYQATFTGSGVYGCSIATFYAGAAPTVLPGRPLIVRQAVPRAAVW